jgi:heme-degrading monooxygenase HmoA
MAEGSIIMRRWSARIRTADRNAYAAYIGDTGVVDYLATPGNLGCEMLMRDRGDGSTEVTTLSWWESMDAIRAFAGDDVETARYYPEDDRFLLERPDHVEHHEVVVEKLGLALRRQ